MSSRITPEGDNLKLEELDGDEHAQEIGSVDNMDKEKEMQLERKASSSSRKYESTKTEKHFDADDLDGDGDLGEELEEVELSEDIYSLASQIMRADEQTRSSLGSHKITFLAYLTFVITFMCFVTVLDVQLDWESAFTHGIASSIPVNTTSLTKVRDGGGVHASFTGYPPPTRGGILSVFIEIYVCSFE